MPFLIRILWRAAVSAGAVVSALALAVFVVDIAYAQNAAPPAPNSDPNYQALRNLTLGSEAVSVSNFDLKRDAGTFHLHSGTVCFVTPVNGKVTGAVFQGEGNFVLDPPLEMERRSLKLLTKEDEFSERFEHLVLRFTDSTYDEIKRAGTPATGGCDDGLLKDSQNTTRHKLRNNLEARILQDVLSPEPGGLFVAFVHGKHYNGQELYVVDPHGVHIGYRVAPEEVEFMTYDENKYGCWAAFHLAHEYKDGTATGNQKNNWWTAIEHEQLDTQIERSGNLIGKATTTFSAVANGLRVVHFSLFHSLRVQGVTDAGGQALAFIQEDKKDDAQFFVILPKPLAAGEKYSITTTYAGKEAVTNEGGDNYYPVARDDWYPNSGDNIFGNFATYDMTFRIPKGLQMAAAGVPTENNEKTGISHWISPVPQAVAGFNLGRFKVEETKLTKPEYVVQSYANENPPDWVQGVQHATGDDLPLTGRSHIGEEGVALGTMSTTELNKKALAEAELAVRVYTDYFGLPVFNRLEITQQTADNYGQAWPGLVYLPITYFFDTTTRHSLNNFIAHRCPRCVAHGDDPYGYFKVVAPHEVAHQWWGHTITWGSYRDQWMSEGFADASASIYLQMVYAKEPQRFLSFWHDERELLTERNKDGFRAIDVGPLTMGYRLSSSRAGFDIYRDLVYPKGAYVLHMIRMMMRDRQTGDQLFKQTMQDFVKTYSGKSATTEDFKAMIEKHMTSEMDLDGNHRMDWFFNEYVYGTQLPTYKSDASFDIGPDGDVVMSLKLAQSGVDDKFRMLVPVYLEMADGNIAFLGRATMIGNKTIEQKAPLRGLKTRPRRAVINYYDDVLATP